MDILVCLKLVSEAHYTDALDDTSRERLTTGRLAINPADQYALELALRLRETDYGRLSVLTMGPKSAESLLWDALAMGADAAYHLCDPLLAGSDTLATASALAGVIHSIGFSGVLVCGQKSIDSETGHIGPQLSILLGIPVLTNVMDFGREGNDLMVNQLRDEGIVSLLLNRPVILTVHKGVRMIRRPTIIELRKAHEKQIRLLDLREIGMRQDEVGRKGSATFVLKTEPLRHSKRIGERTESVPDGVTYLLHLLKGEGDRYE